MNIKCFLRNNNKFRLAIFTVFMSILSVSINPVIVKNITEKEFFVISTYRNSEVRIGYSVKSGMEVDIDKIYTGSIRKELYSYPETLYFYNNSSDVVCNRIFGTHYSIEMEGYIHKIELTGEIVFKIIITLLNERIIYITE